MKVFGTGQVLQGQPLVMLVFSNKILMAIMHKWIDEHDKLLVHTVYQPIKQFIRTTNKYMPHQGKQEMARRLRRRTGE